MGMNLPKASLSSLFHQCPLALKHRIKLVTADEKKTVVAEFHRAHYFATEQKARLEVHAEGMEMLDYIVLTFVFAETRRRAREEVAASLSIGGLSQVGIWHGTV